jgi:hypothetical protein
MPSLPPRSAYPTDVRGCVQVILTDGEHLVGRVQRVVTRDRRVMRDHREQIVAGLVEPVERRQALPRVAAEREVPQQREHVDARGELRAIARLGPVPAGEVAKHERQVQVLLVDRHALALQAVRAGVLAVVRREHHDRVLAERRGIFCRTCPICTST